MEKKSAIIFDTNFLFENKKNLTDIVKKLSETYEVFIPQLCVEERISQQYLDNKKKYEEISMLKKKNFSFVNIDFNSTFEEFSIKQREIIQQSYKDLVKGNIINFAKTEDTFTNIFDRACRKVPPFGTDDKASDKGFKDTILWLSLIDFFSITKNQENVKDIIFISSDKVFSNNTDTLKKEFLDKTCLQIEFHDNKYILDYLNPDSAIENVSQDKSIFDKEELVTIRNEIDNILDEICNKYRVDSEGNVYYSSPRFQSSLYFNNSMIAEMFSHLNDILEANIFSKKIAIDDLFPNLNCFYDSYYMSIDIVQSLLKLYVTILKEYPDFIEAFYKCVCENLNKNYKVDDFPADIPF